MKKTMLLLLVGLMAVSGLTAAAKNPLGPNYKINPAQGLKIDGDVSDWSKAMWVTYDASTVGDTGGKAWGNPNAVCKFAMMYDAEALYCASEVEDDVISYNLDRTPYTWWERDGVQWFLDFTNNDLQEIVLWEDEGVASGIENEAGEKWLPGEMIIVIGATEDQKDLGTRRWPVGTRGGSRSDSFDLILDDGSTARGEINEQWQSVVKMVGTTKYIIEVKIPWSSLETSLYYSDPANPDDYSTDELNKKGWKPLLPKPLAGSTILFTHLCIDTDLPEGGYDSQTMWVGDGDNDTNWSDATFVAPAGLDHWDLF